MKRLSIGIIVLASLLGSAHVALALHRHTPAHLQVTTAPSQTIGGQIFAGQGAIEVFHSDSDLLGNGNTTPQIFVFNLGERVKRHKIGLYQITRGDQACLNPTAAKRAHVLGFVSSGDVLMNGSVGRQIFFSTKAKFATNNVPLFQLTRAPGESFSPALSGDGRSMVFASTADLAGQGLPPGTHLYRSQLRAFQRSKCAGYPCPSGPGMVSNGLDTITPVEAFNPSVDFKGLRVAFESTGDAAGTGCVNGARQIFVKDYTTTPTATFKQLTFGTGDSRNPVITGDASAVVFESDADLLHNGSTRTQIFVSDLTQTPPKLQQITFGTDGDSTNPTFAILTSGGYARITFLSDATLLPTGTPGTKQAFVYDVGPGVPARLTQITAVHDSITSVPASVFSFVVFPNRDDIAGNGNASKQMFLLNTFRFLSPLPGTPTPIKTPAPEPGVPANIALALLTQQAANNGNNTLTTFIAATISDAYGNPIPDGTSVDFTMAEPADGAVVTDGQTNTDPLCDSTNFETATGIQVLNQPGVSHSCVTYPGAEVGTTRTITATVGTLTLTKTFTLPPPANDCTANGIPCSDGNPCTVGDVCGGGDSVNPPTCISGSVAPCADDGNPCTIDQCNPFTGQCGVPVTCADDGNPCTDDVCDLSTGACGVPLTGGACDDGNLCTTGDTCSAGVCQPGPATVCSDDGNPCTNDVCDPLTGKCGIPQACQCP
jgi:WD40-like Beta Propeller Repeat